MSVVAACVCRDCCEPAALRLVFPVELSRPPCSFELGPKVSVPVYVVLVVAILLRILPGVDETGIPRVRTLLGHASKKNGEMPVEWSGLGLKI